MRSKPTKLDKQIGKAIMLHRKMKNKTREELSKKVGVSSAQIFHYESGRQQISIGRLAKIAKILHVKFLRLLPEELGGEIIKD